MKIIFLIFCIHVVNSACLGQKDSFYINGCAKIKVQKICENRIQKRIVDTCFNESLIIESSVNNSIYMENGNYATFWDSDFKVPRLKGSFYDNNPIGVWQQFYKNGSLLCEGQVQVIYLTLNSLKNDRKPDSFIIVNNSNPLDTVIIPRNRKNYDSLNNLVTYSGLHSFDLAKNQSNHKAIYGFPGNISYKVGEWKYYDEKGILVRREYYKNGMLIKKIIQ